MQVMHIWRVIELMPMMFFTPQLFVTSEYMFLLLILYYPVNNTQVHDFTRELVGMIQINVIVRILGFYVSGFVLIVISLDRLSAIIYPLAHR